MKVASPVQMNEIDYAAINQLGIPSMILMEHAALQILAASRSMLDTFTDKTILILAGKGNNGGDALAAARHLAIEGAHIEVYVTAEKSRILGDAAVNLSILERMGIPIHQLIDSAHLTALKENLLKGDLILDGILGTGLKGLIKGMIRDVIDLVNHTCCPILSIDIPSGISGETGKILGTCIYATRTVTFALPKIGLLIHPGCEAAGELIVAPIGIPDQLIDQKEGMNTYWIEGSDAAKLLPKRPPDSNKGTYGKVLLITGSPGMTGSGYLAGAAALRAGAGLVYLAVPAALASIYNTLLPEAITLSQQESPYGTLSELNSNSLLHRMTTMSSAVLGPGLSTYESTAKLVIDLITHAEIPLVLDADALNVISKAPAILKELKAPVVITPHPGEMARLVDCTVEEIQNNRIEIAKEFSRKHQIITVLKGARTLVASPDGSLYINSTGNPGMATGGTGDVLAGLIGALLGQGLKPLEAAICGVYLHGLAGDLVAAKKGLYGLIAGDLLDSLPDAFNTLIR